MQHVQHDTPKVISNITDARCFAVAASSNDQLRLGLGLGRCFAASSNDQQGSNNALWRQRGTHGNHLAHPALLRPAVAALDSLAWRQEWSQPRVMLRPAVATSDSGKQSVD